MAHTSFLELTNRVLRKLNEVELNALTFADVRGVHAAAKDAVNDAIDEMNKVSWEWPFNAYEHTQVLQVGVEEYAWPIAVSFKAVDWYSFQIQKDDVLDINSYHLKPINRDEWYSYLKDKDDDAEGEGIKPPEYVLPTHGTGFTVSHSPDKEYTLKFRYYKHPTRLELDTDITTSPPEFDYIILQGALYIMYLFLDNDQRSQSCERKFLEGIERMRRLLIPEDFHITTGAMNVGGENRSGGFYWGEGGY